MVTITPPTTTGPLSAGERAGRGWLGRVLAIAGALCLGVAWMIASRSGSDGAPAAPPLAASSLATPIGVSVYASVYEPGQSSGWHRHEGTHVVTVVSGTLAVYDDDCIRRTYAAGDAYIGGPNPHMARNDGGGPVHMVVTNVSGLGASASDFSVPVSAPDGCLPS